MEQTVCAGLAGSLAADLRGTPKTVPPSAQKSPRFQIQIPASGSTTQTLFLREDGTAAGAVGANATAASNPRYRVTINFIAPSSTTQKGATTARIFITWPALADMSAGAAPTKFSGSFESMTAFDRN